MVDTNKMLFEIKRVKHRWIKKLNHKWLTNERTRNKVSDLFSPKFIYHSKKNSQEQSFLKTVRRGSSLEKKLLNNPKYSK